MVKEKRLAVGFMVMLVLIGLTAWAFASRRAELKGDSVAGASLPPIPANKLDEIEIYKSADDYVRLSKVDGKWVVSAPVQGEADSSAADTAVEKLTELKVTGVAATHKDNHKALEIDDQTGIRVIAKEKGKTLADLVLGVSRSGSTMVREHGKDKVLSVAGSIKWTFAKDLKSWRNRKILALEAGKIARVDYKHDNVSFSLVNKDGSWDLADGSKAIKKFSASKAQSLVNNVASLNATDFAADSVTPEQAGLDHPNATVTVSMQAAEGTKPEVHTVIIGKKNPSDENQYFIQRTDKPIIYLTTKYIAERLMPTEKDLQEDEKKEGDAPPTPLPGAGMPGMPPGAGGGQQLPPEVMRQIQQQLQQQQGMQ
ncbi:MAG: DUF4340 domain-containing protein [Myxococcales bacterium]|nr:MAG: DUF4340 domain-containing protein [Myxococcales bacterium]